VNKTVCFSTDPFAGFREEPLKMQIGTVRDRLLLVVQNAADAELVMPITLDQAHLLQRAIEAAIREANKYARAGQKAAAARTN
jgi:hypothetical protein